MSVSEAKPKLLPAMIDAVCEGLRKAGVAGVLATLGVPVPARFT